MADVPEDVQRWTAKRRVALVLSIVRGETSVVEAARKHGLTVAEVEEWQERLLSAAENALRARPKDEEAVKDEQIKKLKQKVGELVLDLDILREAAKGRPTDPTTSGECSRPCRTFPSVGSVR
jgi:transposase-like protein